MRLDDCLNYLLTTAKHSVFRQLAEKLDAYDITPVQYEVLCCLWEKGQKKPKEIADYLHIEASTVSGVLSRMENKGLIERRLNTENRRTIIVSLTPKSMMLRPDIMRAVSEANCEVMSAFTEKEKIELKMCLQVLTKVNEA